MPVIKIKSKCAICTTEIQVRKGQRTYLCESSNCHRANHLIWNIVRVHAGVRYYQFRESSSCTKEYKRNWEKAYRERETPEQRRARLDRKNWNAARRKMLTLSS